MAEPVERVHETVEQITAAISPDFIDLVGAETVQRLVAESYADLSESARITLFVPLLTQRYARERLRVVVGDPGLDGAGEAGHESDARGRLDQVVAAEAVPPPAKEA